jgi:hypothetical protein
MRAIRRVLACLTLAAACGAVGCGLFEPADPEAPNDNSVIIEQDYSTPDNTLATIARGLHGKNASGAITAYIQGFGFTFVAEFDPLTQIRNPERFPLVWGLLDERQFFSQFIQLTTNPYGLAWEIDPGSPTDDIDDAAGTARLHRRYTVWDSTTATSARRIAVGFADLEFVRTSSPTAWVITKWSDREDATADFGLGERSYGERRVNASSSSP